MDETMNTPVEEGYEDFAAAFGDDGYQTDTAEEVTEEPTEPTEEPTEEPADNAEGGEDSADDSEDAQEETGAEAPPAADTFTLRVNKEDRTVNREEVIALAQKGADYDRVKNQLTERDNTIAQLQANIDGSKEALDLLALISEETKKPIPELLEGLHLSLRMKNGETEAEAKANIRAIKAERAMKAAQEKSAPKESQADGKARAAKEVDEFHKRFPGVELSEELCGKLTADVRAGLSIADAYAKMKQSEKDAEIAELRRQLEAEKQNNKNKAKAVGSQKDSGGRRTKNAEDDFFAAFEK